jgi:hypothetical protein
MTAKEKRFIVVSIGDSRGFGYDEHELPILVQLGEAHSPDLLVMNRTGLLAHFLTSRSRLKKVKSLITATEALRTANPSFGNLKIGMSEGPLVGEFDWLGRINRKGMGLLGEAINTAVKQEEAPFSYRSTLSEIANQLHVQIA